MRVLAPRGSWAVSGFGRRVVQELAPGFKERTEGRGLVRMGWVPYISILAHRVVGAFLMHCCWSSEGLLFGHPLIMLPIYGEQWTNARCMEGKKVPRNENDRSFDHEGIVRIIWAVILEEETKQVFLTNAKKLRKVVGDYELHEHYIDQFSQQLRYYKKRSRTERASGG
ncbi:hypothetical protein EJB05_04994, partial [Eragrostis curvula]